MQEVYLSDPSTREDVVPALRELFSQHPATAYRSPDTLARLLWMLRYLSYRPSSFEVEVALEVLDVERGAA